MTWNAGLKQCIMPHLLDGWYIYFDKVEVKKRVQSIFGCSITRDSNRECFFRFEIKKTFAPLSIFVFASPVLSLSYLSLVFLTSRFLFEALQIPWEPFDFGRATYSGVVCATPRWRYCHLANEMEVQFIFRPFLLFFSRLKQSHFISFKLILLRHFSPRRSIPRIQSSNVLKF